MPITIEGLTECQNSLEAMEVTLGVVKLIILERFAEAVQILAQERCPVDTGALQASIHQELIENTFERIVIDVVAGSPDIARGAGAFVMSTKMGVWGRPTPVSFAPTSEYADLAEAKAGYMENAYQWALANVDKYLTMAIKTLVL